MSGAYTVAGLLFALEAVGVGVALNEAGDGLKLSGRGSPPADLLAEVRRLKPDLLAHLTAKEEAGSLEAVALDHFPDAGKMIEAAPLPSSPPVGREKEAPKGTHKARPLPDWATEAQKPGRCGSCARAVDASEEWGPLMVRCTCDPVAWWPLSPPLALHVGATCGAYQKEGEAGRGWRAKGNGKAWGPLSPVPWEDLPTLEDGAPGAGAA